MPLPLAGTLASVASIENFVIPGPAGGLPVRLYTPEGVGPFPVLMFFQKSWCHGNLDTSEIMCRKICHGARCLVMTVDNHLAPENPFPAAIEDCYAATSWMSIHATALQGDPTRIAVGGESGGGNYAAAVALMGRDRGGPVLKFQLLICPAADFRVTTDSWNEFDGYIIPRREACTTGRSSAQCSHSRLTKCFCSHREIEIDLNSFYCKCCRELPNAV